MGESRTSSQAKKKQQRGRLVTAKKKPSSVVKTVPKSSSKSSKNTTKSLMLPKDVLLNMYDLMVRARVLEERMIQVYRRGEAFFWIGGPGEEAFGVALGLLVNKGQGPSHDFLHLHYRCTPTLLAMGMSDEDALRLIMNKASDTSTGGRNFANHYCFPQWNVAPVSSPIGIQYGIAIGTAIAQKRAQGGAVSIITGGDAGSAEGDFATSLIWSSRPANPLPMYITVQNNKWGISTDYDSQHGEKSVADRGKAFGIRTGIYNGNDPIESYLAIKSDLDYIRKNNRPVLAEFKVSRLYGHSSASGANRINNEECCIETFEKKLVDQKVITTSECKKIKDEHFENIRVKSEQIREEPGPAAETLWDHTFANGENGDWRKF